MIKKFIPRKVRNVFRQWWECHVTKRCSYYEHYLVYGPADLTHIGYHRAEDQALRHFKACQRDWYAAGPCQVCLNWEKRVRA